jgi:hypothetical protein
MIVEIIASENEKKTSTTRVKYQILYSIMS